MICVQSNPEIEFVFSPDVILSGRLGLKHLLTNLLTALQPTQSPGHADKVHREERNFRICHAKSLRVKMEQKKERNGLNRNLCKNLTIYKEGVAGA